MGLAESDTGRYKLLADLPRPGRADIALFAWELPFVCSTFRQKSPMSYSCSIAVWLVLSVVLLACGEAPGRVDESVESFPVRVILDTDANNELDDQHAMAYLLFNGDHFDLAGITVNRTHSGGPLESHMEEARRVVRLTGLEGKVRVIPGADASFEAIRPSLGEAAFDGHEAVRFIVEEARKAGPEGILLLPIGKLTNIALALALDPSIAGKVRILWLGSNYPDPGEYNQDNDEEALRYLLDADVAFEIALVRYGQPSGTDAVRVTPAQVMDRFAGLGPEVSPAVEGRHGGTFTRFGDYSVSLFEGIDLHGFPPARALFDLAAVAIAKEPAWAEPRRIPAPQLGPDGRWVERPGNGRTIVLWEHFQDEAIIDDFVRALRRPVPVD